MIGGETKKKIGNPAYIHTQTHTHTEQQAKRQQQHNNNTHARTYYQFLFLPFSTTVGVVWCGVVWCSHRPKEKKRERNDVSLLLLLFGIRKVVGVSIRVEGARYGSLSKTGRDRKYFRRHSDAIPTPVGNIRELVRPRIAVLQS